MTDLGERHATTSPLERFECRLVRHAVEQPGSIHPRDEATLRYALALGRLGPCRLADGTDLDLAPHVAELRDRALAWLSPALAGTKVDAVELARSVPALAQAARMARSRIFVRYGQQLSAERLEKELCQRALVLACGGGGGVGYGHLGVFALLESAGLRPALIAGSSMGSVLGLFRARALRFEVAQVPRILGEVETRRLFRPFSTESRWTIPSAIRLALREGIGPYFEYDGVPLRLRDLPIPLLVAVGGLRRGALPRPIAHYEALAQKLAGLANPLSPAGLQALARAVTGLLTDFTRLPDLLTNIVLGESAETRELDVVDAVGFSSSVPGALHYELGRESPADEGRLKALLAGLDVLRLTDGGVTDNVPAKTAWEAVQRGFIGTRNAFVLAVDGFAPKVSTPFWLPLQHLAWENVKRSVPYASHFVSYRRPLSPLALLPPSPVVMEAVDRAKRDIVGDLPWLQRMLEPLPGASALA